MALVDYATSSSSSSGDESTSPPALPTEEDSDAAQSRPRKRRRTEACDEDEQHRSTLKQAPLPVRAALPALPATFRDLYSSTVRTTVRDDPSLHAGRQRVSPHVAGQWPTHVYLEWHPTPKNGSWLNDLVRHAGRGSVVTQPRTSAESTATIGRSTDQDTTIHSLVTSDLGVPLPLHISLSRPLQLKTREKDDFTSHLRDSVADSGAHAFVTQPSDLVWHPNEDCTRWFLVLRLRRPPHDELRKLLRVCNALAARFQQPLLYHSTPARTADPGADVVGVDDNGNKTSVGDVQDSFHISIAWALRPPVTLASNPPLGKHASHQARTTLDNNERDPVTAIPVAELPSALQAAVAELQVPFSQVKLRIGQDVTVFGLPESRSR